MGDGTPAMVDARLESAADVFRSLPEVKPKGYLGSLRDRGRMTP